MIDRPRRSRSLEEDEPLSRWAVVGIGAAGVALTIILWVFQSWNEARAYNSATGSNVSTWDAMWINLRVVGGSRE